MGLARTGLGRAGGWGSIRVFTGCPHITQTLVEEQAEDIVLEIAGVDEATEQIRRAPEVPFEFGQGQLGYGLLGSFRGGGGTDYALFQFCQCSPANVFPALTAIPRVCANNCGSGRGAGKKDVLREFQIIPKLGQHALLDQFQTTLDVCRTE